MDTFIQTLSQQLKKPLPGSAAHRKMIPTRRLAEYEQGFDLRGAKQSAVLLLFYQRAGGWYFPLIQRPVYTGNHSGQIGFPGGKPEPGDADFAATALREAWEEIGIEAVNVKLIGQLSPVYIAVSGFLVHVFVGYIEDEPLFHADEHEVAEIIEIAVEDLMSKNEQVICIVNPSLGLPVEAPAYHLKDRVIWGATAMILSELQLTIDDCR